MSQASWRVGYTGGSTLAQFDATSPLFHAAGGEVPYRAIDWSRVETLTITSQWCEQTFDIGAAPAGFQYSLRSRHLGALLVAGPDMVSMVFMLCLSTAGELAGPENTPSVFFIFPDGTTHHCSAAGCFNCPDVHRYAQASITGRTVPIMPEHHGASLDASVVAQ